MGKDHEFLEAARSGNITVVEKILNQKSKRSGPLASLRRGPGANVQDNSGYSALHHATLSGHTDVVRLLLRHDASPNLHDARGSSPLHLAAWAGHQDIVKLFLTHPHRPANPNLQTIENETPLHCAAQHGHTGALTTLLAHGANPNVTNIRNETPLDLAAQYGRLQVVQMLIRAHPELLSPFKLDGGGGDGGSDSHRSGSTSSFSRHRVIVSHSPLHLASRNGHKNVVEVLLAAGVNVNLLTPSGTALHEAALCGKDSVVRTLLDFGADLDATDCEKRTALDILEEFPPHVTKGIVSVINNHRNSILYDSESDDVLRDSHYQLHHPHRYHQAQKNNVTPMSLGSSYENNRTSPVLSYCNSHHDIASPSSSLGSLGPPSPRQRTTSGDHSEFYVPMEPCKKLKPAAPKKPPRRNLSVSPTHLYGRSGKMSMSVDSYGGGGGGGGALGGGGCGSGSDTSSIIPGHPVNYEYIFLAHTGTKVDEKSSNMNNRQNRIDDYVQMTGGSGLITPKIEPRTILMHSYENTTLKSYNPNRKLRRNKDNYEQFSMDFSNGKEFRSVEILPTKSPPIAGNSSTTTTPQSPTNYQQPPTPEHPPPSAVHAEKYIHERIRPLSQEYKRHSGIHQHALMLMESGTSPPEPLCASLCASSGSLSSSVSMSDRSVSTDCVEEFIGDVPFAGLFKGSTMTLNNANLSFQRNYDGGVGLHQQQQQHERPKTLCAQHDQCNDPRMEYHQNRSLSFGGIITSSIGGGGGAGITAYHARKHQLRNDEIVAAAAADDNDERRNGGDAINSGGSNEKPNVVKRDLNHDVLSPFDEQEAWAKISEIMESFGSGILSVGGTGNGTGPEAGTKESDDDVDDSNESKTKRLGSSSSAAGTSSYQYTSIAQFLNEHNLPHLERSLIENGFDHIMHLNGILDDGDLKALNIPLQNDGKKLLEAVQKLPSAKSLPVLQQQQQNNNNNNNSMLNVDQWLQSIHLSEYIDIFKRHLYTNLEGVCRVWEVELQTVLEINKLGHRKRILYSISSNRTTPTITMHELNDDLSTLEANIMDLRDSGTNDKLPSTKPKLCGSTAIKHNNKKNRPAPKPPVRASSLEIRAPSELLLGLPSNLRTQWRHPANTLITSSVTYDVYYLGSTVVKELRGTESTRKSIQKLKCDDRQRTTSGPIHATASNSAGQQQQQQQQSISLQNHAQMQHQQQRKQLVRLSISHRGVEFINIESQDTICEHEIRNINCACQDADDLSHFAYITKDADMNTHYCHVFNADSMDLATEIILTLGQAFEVAYQLALRETSPKTPIRGTMFEIIK